MLYRTVYIGNPAILRLKDRQMRIRTTADDMDLGSIPVEDIGLVIIDHSWVTITQGLIQALVENNAVIVSCDQSHMPLGMMISERGHTECSERIKVQVEASDALKKQLWSQIVKAKLSRQRELLCRLSLPYEPMDDYVRMVKPGDETNMEGVGARYYWGRLFSEDFRRGQTDDLPNVLLNYGYAILRATVARALTSTGLLLVLGLFHRNKYNPYCLADDLMEPFRPFIDALAIEWLADHALEEGFTKEARAHMLQCATMDVRAGDKLSPLLVAVRDAASSLYACYTGRKRKLVFPSFP
ncbi:MAG: type II CRISPR-associated endonuclease Cas1 [Bacteroidales bacterium]|nr:type II CRISPR-associated endonuclease Cas1 [Bacteroidales bacterium]